MIHLEQLLSGAVALAQACAFQQWDRHACLHCPRRIRCVFKGRTRNWTSSGVVACNACGCASTLSVANAKWPAADYLVANVGSAHAEQALQRHALQSAAEAV